MAESPDLEHITSKAKVHGYVPVKQTDFETLKTLAHKPDLDHIIEKSKSLGYTPVKDLDYDVLKNWRMNLVLNISPRNQKNLVM